MWNKEEETDLLKYNGQKFKSANEDELVKTTSRENVK